MLTKSVITFTVCNGSIKIYRLVLEISYLRGQGIIRPKWRLVSSLGCLIWAQDQNMTKLLFRNEEQ